MDLFSRKIIAWKLSGKADADFVITTFQKAYRTRNAPYGLMFHSDRGTQYTAFSFRQLLDSFHVVQYTLSFFIFILRLTKIITYIFYPSPSTYTLICIESSNTSLTITLKFLLETVSLYNILLGIHIYLNIYSLCRFDK